jgi:type I restriction enzyme M protein
MAVWSVVDYHSLPGLRLDPEYYHPQYLELAAQLRRANPVTIDTFAYVTDGIHGSPVWVDSDGITYLSAKSVKDNFFELGTAGQISKSQHEANPRTSARIDDVLVTTVGTIGNTAVVYKDILPANMDRHLGIIRITDTQAVDPYYLATFLNCRFGRFQTIRESTGNVQLNLFIDKIKKLLVPTGAAFNSVGQSTRTAYKKRMEAKSLYAQAEALLLHELGLDTLDLSHQTTFTATFAEVMEARRLDAEYFQPKYRRVLQGIANSPYPSKALGELIEPIRNGFDYRQFTDNGTPYIRVGDIQNGRINLQGAAKVNMSVDQVRKNIQLKPGDVLFTRKGSFGNAAVVNEDCVQAIISSEIMLLRPRNQLDYLLLSDYLSLFLNSNLGYQQIERNVHGVAFYSISQPDLARVRVVILPPEKQQTLVDTLRQSSRSEQEATQLLEQAKQRVEELILEGN